MHQHCLRIYSVTNLVEIKYIILRKKSGLWHKKLQLPFIHFFVLCRKQASIRLFLCATITSYNTFFHHHLDSCDVTKGKVYHFQVIFSKLTNIYSQKGNLFNKCFSSYWIKLILLVTIFLGYLSFSLDSRHEIKHYLHVLFPEEVTSVFVVVDNVDLLNIISKPSPTCNGFCQFLVCCAIQEVCLLT